MQNQRNGHFSHRRVDNADQGAMMLEENEEWSLNRRCMQLEGLQTLIDTLPARMSEVAR